MAQFETSAVPGTVRDPSNNLVPAANATLLSLETGIRFSATTNEFGDYQFLNVRIGLYRVTAEKPGFRTTQQGYPAGLTDPDRFNPLLAIISYIPRESPTGYVQTWSFSIQREVARHTVVDVGYVGNKSTHLILFADYNQARPNRPGENASIQARRPNPAFSAITVTFPGAFGNYHALQARLE